MQEPYNLIFMLKNPEDGRLLHSYFSNIYTISYAYSVSEVHGVLRKLEGRHCVVIADISGESSKESVAQLLDSGEVPVIALADAAHGDSRFSSEAFQKPFAGFLERPLSKDKSILLVNKVIQERLQIQASHKPSRPTEINGTEAASENQGFIKNRNTDKTMLIVDDSKLNRVFLKSIFQYDYLIKEVENGIQAFQYIENNYEKITIMMLDLVMPEMGGIELLNKLKEDERYKEIPVVVMSGAEDSEVTVLNLGAVDYITKPFTAVVAKRRVENVFARSRQLVLERELELTRAIEEMRIKAERDSLTNLLNRSAFEVRINHHFASSPDPVGRFIMMDLDNFKSVNDGLGHNKGDELIHTVSEILTRSFRAEDLIARMGGDEFAVFIPNDIPEQLFNNKIERLLKKLDIDVDGVRVSASMGICVASNEYRDYQTLYNNADAALLTAKRRGKNLPVLFSRDLEVPPQVLFRSMDWLIEEAADYIFVREADTGKVLYVNNTLCSFLGMSKREAEGQLCSGLFGGNEELCAIAQIDTLGLGKYEEIAIRIKEEGKIFIKRSRAVSWGGKRAFVIYLNDITKHIDESGKLKER